MKYIKKLLIGLTALTPISTLAMQPFQKVLGPKDAVDYNTWNLKPGQKLKINVNGEPLEIKYSDAYLKLGLDTSKKTTKIIGVKIHEEDSSIDFTDFDGLVVSSEMLSDSATPPNFTTID